MFNTSFFKDNTAFKDFEKNFIGFEDQFNRISKMHDDLTKSIPNYPPYNIKKTGENTYVIEMAVAGFARQDIEIELDGGKMIVKGNVASDDKQEDFLWKGIAARNFTRIFALEDQVKVKDAEMFNGMLKVFLERIIPESKKPKKVEVKEKASKSSKQLLTEDPQGRDL
jgi:molecular chaperone IbpA